MKTRSVGAELFLENRRTGKRTNVTKLLDAFHKFAKAPKNRFNILLEKKY